MWPLIVTMPVGLPTSDGAVSADYRATVLPNSEVPALLGLSAMEKSKAILDLRHGKLHMWTANNLDDIEITVKKGREHNVVQLPMVKAPSGHLILKCTDYPKMPNPAETSAFSLSHGQDSQNMLVVPDGINQYN